MGLRSNFLRLMDQYGDVFDLVFKTKDFKNSFSDLIRKDIPECIKREISLPDDIYKIKGSYGAGKWTAVPWIAIFDTRITSSAQKGIYIVYLLNKDTKKLYLTLNQGATNIAQKGDEPYSNLINTGVTGYDMGAIYSKEYTMDNLPEDAELVKDLEDFISYYKQYYENIYRRKDNEGKKMLVSVDDDNLIENFYLSIKSKPFVILAGTSGTGKTRLIRLFAEAVGATARNGRYLQVAVKPDWSDSTDLFGHVNLNREYCVSVFFVFG